MENSVVVPYYKTFQHHITLSPTRREITFRKDHMGGSKIRWINTVVPKIIVIALMALMNADPNLVNNQGPTPMIKTKISKPVITKINGNQARLSEVEGIIVLLTAKTR